MLNRRKFIQTILSDARTERNYFDFKQTIDISSEAGRGKLLKSIVAFANANRQNPAFIIVGIEDGTRSILGAEEIDDVRLQQLICNYTQPPLQVLYEAVPFPHSASTTTLGLLTIHPANETVTVSRNIWKLKKGDIYTRAGSEIQHINHADVMGTNPYSQECLELIANSSVRLKDTLNELIFFYTNTPPSYQPAHRVYQDRHVICYSGWKNDNFDIASLSEVNVELLTEGLSLFFSAVNQVQIFTTENSFTVCQYLHLFWEGTGKLYPYEETSIKFNNDGTYHLNRSIIFKTPTVSPIAINKLLEHYEHLNREQLDWENHLGELEILPSMLLIAALNGSDKAKYYLENFINGRADGVVGEALSEALEVFYRVTRQGS